MYIRLTSYLIIFFSSLSFANQTLPDKVKLSTKLWPPYHFYNDNGDLVGISVKVLQCSLKKLNINLEIEVVPWSRAQQHTQIGISDGFFRLLGMPLEINMQAVQLISLLKTGFGTH